MRKDRETLQGMGVRVKAEDLVRLQSPFYAKTHFSTLPRQSPSPTTMATKERAAQKHCTIKARCFNISAPTFSGAKY